MLYDCYRKSICEYDVFVSINIPKLEGIMLKNKPFLSLIHLIVHIILWTFRCTFDDIFKSHVHNSDGSIKHEKSTSIGGTWMAVHFWYMLFKLNICIMHVKTKACLLLKDYLKFMLLWIVLAVFNVFHLLYNDVPISLLSYESSPTPPCFIIKDKYEEN